jgi:hypothetical protein
MCAQAPFLFLISCFYKIIGSSHSDLRSFANPATMGLAPAESDKLPGSVSAILVKTANFPSWPIASGPDMSQMDKIAGLKEILALDPKNSFARYGIAMELANRGDTTGSLAEFDLLLQNDPDYTAGYFMSAQTLAGVGRKSEAIERLKAGIGCAARSGNSHALSEMQAMLDELDR